MKVLLLLLAANLALACEYRSYSFRLTFGTRRGSYAQVEYQFPNGPSVKVFRDNVMVQEIGLSDNLGKEVEQYPIEGGFAIKGEGREIQFTLNVNEDDFYEFKVAREMQRDLSASDCFFFGEDSHWFGGPEQKHQQYWPINQQKHSDYSYITKEDQSMAIVERIWLNSEGLYVYVDYNSPLFITQEPGVQLCLKGAKKTPYDTRDLRYTYTYYVGVAENPREAYLQAVEQHLGKPSDIPDEQMVLLPIFSTWARYGRGINESVLREFAAEILENDFKSSQFEIDDFWEVCYGSLTINEGKFPNMKQLTDDLKELGFRVTMWIHPFINKDCQPWYDEAKEKGYFTADASGNTDTSWWNSARNQAAYIDFTNPEAVDWFMERLQQVKDASGVDSFKFDAGETSWNAPNSVLHGEDKSLLPSIQSRTFTEKMATFGKFIEVRTGWGNQDQPVFFRMLDKDSNWTIEENGLQSLVPTLLQMNLNGYPFVLSDMIGGNAYNGTPSRELYLRWVEATTFMPAMQYSVVPWDYDEEAVEISRNFNRVHEEVAGPILIAAMREAVRSGTPVNPPLWWIAPTDKTALGIGDQFLVGERLIVAPVVVEGADSRDIYLPEGYWEGTEGTVFDGPTWLRNWPSPVGKLSYFIKRDFPQKQEL